MDDREIITLLWNRAERAIDALSHNPRLSRGLDLALEGHFTDDCP